MGSQSKMIGKLSYLGFAWGQQIGNGLVVGLRSCKGDMVFGISLEAGAVAVSPLYTRVYPTSILLVVSGHWCYAPDLVGLHNLGEGNWVSYELPRGMRDQ